MGILSCKNRIGIYLISRDVCQKQCEGGTPDLREKVNNFLSSVTTKKDFPVATHFNGSTRNHRWEGNIVNDHDPSWSDTKKVKGNILDAQAKVIPPS